MKRILFSVFCVICALQIPAQNIRIDFLKLPGVTAKLYYFQGNTIDSLAIVLDKTGRGTLKLNTPKSVKGIAQLHIPDGGGIEFIIGEPQLQIVCSETLVNKETTSFPGSKENAFLYNSFTRKSQLLEKQGWLQAGTQFYQADSNMQPLLDNEIGKVKASIQQLNDSVSQSSLYAARFLEWADFMNRLYEAEQQQSPEKARIIRNELETKSDLTSLYTSGQLWGNVHNYYISMFNRLDTPEKQEEYAGSINKIAERLTGMLQVAFFESSIHETERFGWSKAQESIAQNIANRYPDMEFKNSNLQRLVGLFRSFRGEKAHALVGLSNTLTGKTLLVFHEAGCGNCEGQLNLIKENYPILQEKGYRVISISADIDSTVFKYHTLSFPWKDKLCDFRGFEGENFKNYGIIGTPTLYVIDEKGIILGRYARLLDTGLISS